mmetsp:Transcript_35402/g.101078  ORF Transcript_35402/g.101078 Transcript_35402/m.101078 type:complete len:228 (+) Transcript_35402:456-1139(+)
MERVCTHGGGTRGSRIPPSRGGLRPTSNMEGVCTLGGGTRGSRGLPGGGGPRPTSNMERARTPGGGTRVLRWRCQENHLQVLAGGALQERQLLHMGPRGGGNRHACSGTRGRGHGAPFGAGASRAGRGALEDWREGLRRHQAHGLQVLAAGTMRAWRPVHMGTQRRGGELADRWRQAEQHPCWGLRQQHCLQRATCLLVLSIQTGSSSLGNCTSWLRRRTAAGQSKI